jgi:hypothetical protein
MYQYKFVTINSEWVFRIGYKHLDLSSDSKNPIKELGDNVRLGFEVFTAVVMKSIIFWDMTPCSLVIATDVSEEHIDSIFRIEEIISAM